MKVLLIDDSNFSLTMMKNTMAALFPDAEITCTTDAQEGVEMFNREAPDLVVTDLLMPEITGEDIVKHVRSANSQCFICVASANIQETVQQELIEMGADLFLEKPVNPKKAKALLEQYMEKSNRA